jgi:cell division protein FtsL
MKSWSALMRQAAVLCGLLAVALGVVLMAVKYQVQALEEELAALNGQIARERQAIQVLKAEFSYLTEPDRLRRLASGHLGLAPIEPRQLATLATMEVPAPATESPAPGMPGAQPHRPAAVLGVTR